jgi:hypothetical protein
MVLNIFKNNFFNFNKMMRIPLGRWNIENNYRKTNLKIDYANEDHCGTCFYSKKN